MVYLLHKVLPDESAESIARKYNLPPCVLPSDIRTGNTLKIGIAGRGERVETILEYIIKPAETLESIARRFEIAPDKILRENPDIYPYVGERIKIYK